MKQGMAIFILINKALANLSHLPIQYFLKATLQSYLNNKILLLSISILITPFISFFSFLPCKNLSKYVDLITSLLCKALCQGVGVDLISILNHFIVQRGINTITLLYDRCYDRVVQVILPLIYSLSSSPPSLSYTHKHTYTSTCTHIPTHTFSL